MLDGWTSNIILPFLQSGAEWLKKYGFTPDQITIGGFCLGMLSMPAIVYHYNILGLVLILLNRCADGLDGALARLGKINDCGGYLDIVLDFIFYSGVVFAFALADPAENSLAAAALIFSFMGASCSFLAFAIMAERRGLQNIASPKGFYYLDGLTEGTETILFFVAICLFPEFFVGFAWGFAAICAATTVTRVVGGYHSIREDERKESE